LSGERARYMKGSARDLGAGLLGLVRTFAHLARAPDLCKCAGKRLIPALISILPWFLRPLRTRPTGSRRGF
jgi:hypothetical protein